VQPVFSLQNLKNVKLGMILANFAQTVGWIHGCAAAVSVMTHITDVFWLYCRRHSNRECARRIRRKREETIHELESLCEELKQENEKLMEAACACLVTWQAALENASTLQQYHAGEGSNDSR